MTGDKVTVETFRRKKAAGEKIAMLTAYDLFSARVVDEAGVDGVLIGDSLGNVVLGYESTLPVTMEDMIHHTKAVVRGAERALVVADMPFLSYQVDPGEALRNAGRFLQEAGASAVKLEGGREFVPAISRLVASGIPVMGHLGLTPQSVKRIGGYKLQAAAAAAASELIDDATALVEAGVFSIVLEKIPMEVAAAVTRLSPVPTIGIGSGPDCDGQILVFHDILGMYGSFRPRYVKRYAEIGEAARAGVDGYVREVAQGVFPSPEHAWHMDRSELAVLEERLKQGVGRG